MHTAISIKKRKASQASAYLLCRSPRRRWLLGCGGLFLGCSRYRLPRGRLLDNGLRGGSLLRRRGLGSRRFRSRRLGFRDLRRCLGGSCFRFGRGLILKIISSDSRSEGMKE